MGDSALQIQPGPERRYTAPALTRGRSRRRPKPWMSVRRSRGRRRVGLRGGCPFKEAGGTREGRMRPSLVQEAKRTSSACLRGIQPEGPGSCRQDPEHVAPVTGYGAKAPAGFPLWMSMVNSGAAIPGRNDRYGARCDAQRQRKLATGLPTALHTAPRSLNRETSYIIPQGRARANEGSRLRGISSSAEGGGGGSLALASETEGQVTSANQGPSCRLARQPVAL